MSRVPTTRLKVAAWLESHPRTPIGGHDMANAIGLPYGSVSKNLQRLAKERDDVFGGPDPGLRLKRGEYVYIPQRKPGKPEQSLAKPEQPEKLPPGHFRIVPEIKSAEGDAIVIDHEGILHVIKRLKFQP